MRSLDPPDGPARPAARDADGPALGDQVTRLARRLRRAFRQAVEPLGLSPHQVRAMRVIGEVPDGLRLSELARALQVAPRSVTDVVDALEAGCWVERCPDPGDRRAVLVRLTISGRELLGEADEIRTAVHRELFDVLSRDEQARLAALLATLNDDPEA